MKQYTITLLVDEKWLSKWYQRPGEDKDYVKQMLGVWLEIYTAGIGISIESIEETEEV